MHTKLIIGVPTTTVRTAANVPFGGETVTEDCTYQDGKCTVCEAAQPSHSI